MQKRRLFKLRNILTALIFLFVPASLQADWEGTIEASIPFTFMVDDEELPAGDYFLSTLEAESNVLKIQSVDGGATLTTITTPYAGDASEEFASGDANPRLVFEQFGGEHYLSEVYVPQRSMAWNVTVPQTVEAHLKDGKSMQTSLEGREGN